MEKLFKLTKAIAPRLNKESNRPFSSGEIYGYLMKDVFLNQIISRLSASEIIYLTFLIYGYKRGNELQVVYDEILSNLFSFSIVYISDERPYTSCSYCGGDGQVQCDYCGGDNEVDCDICDGTGTDGEENCDNCDGTGKESCSQCSSGYEECDVCDGSGEVEDESSNNVSQNEYFSIDSRLLRDLEMMDEFDELENGDDFPSSTFKTYEEWGETSRFDYYNLNQFLLIEVNTNPEINKAKDTIRDESLMDIF